MKLSLTKGLYGHGPSLDTHSWRWRHFSIRELSCPCSRHCRGEYFHDPEFLDALEKLRTQVGLLKINSGHRCREHNREVGGVRDSMHVRAIAADISLKGHSRKQLAKAAHEAGFQGIGYARTYLHVDLGPKRAWTYPGALRAWVRAQGYDPVTGTKPDS
jgi:zinc D-Ala-D-Ala carboxypeptidase